MDDQRTATVKSSDRWLAIILRAFFLGLFVWMVHWLLVPILLGGLLALILYPLEKKLAPKLGRFGRFTPAILTLGALLLGVIPFVIFGLKAISTVSHFFAQDWEATFKKVQGFVAENSSGIIERFHIDTGSLRGQVEQVAKNVGGSAAGWLGGVARGLPAQIIDVFLFSLALFFFLRDGRALTRWLLKLSPFPREDTEELFTSIHNTVNGAILGMLVTAGIQGALTMLALWIFGIPGAFLLGIVATILAVIPMIGTTPITFGAAIFLFVSGRIGAGIGMSVAAAVIGLSDNVIRPWVQSSRGEMHPLIVLLAIFGGIEAFGTSGIFLGPVVAALALWIIDTYADLRIKQIRRQRDPDGESPTSALSATSGGSRPGEA
jgi:predicted PurR-regulated permease PerM